jgi:hypothetical protein
MKCVQNKKTEEIINVGDKRAGKLVDSGEYSYTNRESWKDITCRCNYTKTCKVHPKKKEKKGKKDAK